MLQLTRLAVPLADAVAGDPFYANFDCVVPIPSPWTRRLWRGFCSGSILGDAIARGLGIPHIQGLKIRPGARQAGLNRQARSTNLQRRLMSHLPAPGRVLLIDDVLTTGSTTHQAAIELLGHASEVVHVTTLCSVVTVVQPS
jgi:predicted amidophosphoribosyltransferase